MGKTTTGRPTVMTDEVISRLEEAFVWGCTDNEACLWADIAPATLYKYQDKNPEFTERKDALKQTPILQARKSVINGFTDPRIALQFLERKKKDEFSLKTETEITNPDGSLNPFNKLSVEELKKLASK